MEQGAKFGRINCRSNADQVKKPDIVTYHLPKTFSLEQPWPLFFLFSISFASWRSSVLTFRAGNRWSSTQKQVCTADTNPRNAKLANDLCKHVFTQVTGRTRDTNRVAVVATLIAAGGGAIGTGGATAVGTELIVAVDVVD